MKTFLSKRYIVIIQRLLVKSNVDKYSYLNEDIKPSFRPYLFPSKLEAQKAALYHKTNDTNEYFYKIEEVYK